ncbi:MAG: DUF4861 domain-containing protein [Tannerellaceae bacterium]|jgi:hypothetical protein|nr:DUF4861 domain-containing protein [Tannerellaceae bacterium]
MNRLLFLAMLVTAFSCAKEEVITVFVTNSSPLERRGEIIEIMPEMLRGLPDNGSFIVRNAAGGQVPYQITYDRKIIFPVTVPPNARETYTIRRGIPEIYDTLTYGRQYPERVDDMAWENDRIAFRTYGPALQVSGERAFGYDIWVKNTPRLVVEDRYYQELVNGITYHTDHGNGLDYYSVGPTLGAGTSAFLANDSLVYPYCYKTYEIIDNGPLRFTVRLTYSPLRVGDDPEVIETRLLSLDAGSQLNKVTLSFTGLSRETPLATGIVIHEPSHDYQTDASAGFMAYADPIDPVNGQLYAGAVFTSGLKEAKAVYFSDKEKTERKAAGHVLAISNYTPGTDFTYYWGAGWSKWGFPASADWFAYMREVAQKIKTPLLVTIDA